MSLRIRHLPARVGVLIEKKDYAPLHVYFNPSAAGPYVYVRVTEHSRTKEVNHIMLYDKRTCALHAIAAPLGMLMPSCGLFKGLEDLRIVMHRDRVWFTATATHVSPHMDNEMVVGCMDEDVTHVEKMFRADIAKRPVKNVCPFVWNDRLCLLDIFKRTIWHVGEEDGSMTRLQTLRYPREDMDLRGSTSPVHLHGNTWGFIVHDIIFNDAEQLVTRLAYYHHWVEADFERGVVTYVSSPFWIAHWGIEYVSGLTYNPESGEVEVFFGVQDMQPMKCITTLANLRCGK